MSPARQALLDERDLLLRTLEELEAERASGELTEKDYRALKDDCTTRAAAVLRALDSAEQPRPVAGSQSVVPQRGEPSGGRRRRRLVVGTAVAVLAVLAGLAVLDATGRRGDGDEITGGGADAARTLVADGDRLLAAGDAAAATAAFEEALVVEPGSVRTLLRLATAQVMDGEVDAAIDTYDRVLVADPTDVEALAYQGSLFHRQGDTERALAQLGEAVAADPGYLDAWSLRLAVLADAERLDEGLESLSDLASGGDDDIALAVAQQVAGAVAPVEALRIYDAVIAGAPGNAAAHAYRGWQPVTLVVGGAVIGDDADVILTEALDHLDQAVTLDPDLPDALAFRAVVLHRLGREAEAAAALAAFDASGPPADMEALVEGSGLREALASARDTDATP